MVSIAGDWPPLQLPPPPPPNRKDTVRAATTKACSQKTPGGGRIPTHGGGRCGPRRTDRKAWKAQADNVDSMLSDLALCWLMIQLRVPGNSSFRYQHTWVLPGSAGTAAGGRAAAEGPPAACRPEGGHQGESVPVPVLEKQDDEDRTPCQACCRRGLKNCRHAKPAPCWRQWCGLLPKW